jgi:hypothetical protein
MRKAGYKIFYVLLGISGIGFRGLDFRALS